MSAWYQDHTQPVRDKQTYTYIQRLDWNDIIIIILELQT